MNSDLTQFFENKIPDQIYSAFLDKSNGVNKIKLDYLNEQLRYFDKLVEEHDKWPVSNNLFEKTGIRYFGKVHQKYQLYREHAIEVDKRVKGGISKLQQNYTKNELYQWLYDTLYLVYKLKSEHDESKNGGKLVETLLPEEFHRKDKWEKFNN